MHAPTAIDRLPHRPPFLFLTGVPEVRANESARGEWALTGEEAFFAGHFPGEPIVPGVLIAEALAQLSGLVLSPGRPDARLCRVDVKLTGAVTPPATLSLESRLARAMGGLWQFDVEARAEGRTVARGGITLGSPSAREESP